MLWRLVTRFINEANISDIQRVWHSAENIEREAAALACYYSSYAPARALLKEKPVLEQEIESGRLSWSRVAEKQVN
jgi:hypothetical protein